MMKIFAIFVLFAVVACQERPTVTSDLQAAQRELTVGHEFAEFYTLNNRQRLSDYLMIIERFTLDQFMGAYSSIKIRSLATRDEMAGLGTNACADNVRARWELQVTRFGSQLSQCLNVANQYLHQFTRALNLLHVESRRYTNIIPNSSVNVLTRLNIFTGRDRLSTYINNEFRDLLFIALDLQRQFTEFVNEISIDLDSLLDQYTECYRTLPATFDRAAQEDLASIRRC